MASTSDPFPTVAETLKHPAYPAAVWGLEPHTKGLFDAGKSRGNHLTRIAYEIHGDGPIKLVFIMGLAGNKHAWQRQTLHFGHDNASKYSVLVLDNRGIGESDKPLVRYSTSIMAIDVIELLDSLGWITAPFSSPARNGGGEKPRRQVHLVGISLGGMISQEVAYRIPDQLASLTLICTAASVESGKSWYQTVRTRANMVIPKTMETKIREVALQLFPLDWLRAPDETIMPSPKTTAKCKPAEGSPDGEYIPFDSNFQRFQAQELAKRLDPAGFTSRGVLLQLAAAAGHYKSPEQLEEIGDRIGRERITVIHGLDDNMIEPALGRMLVEMLKPGTSHLVEGMGHAPIVERSAWLNELIETRVAECEKLE